MISELQNVDTDMFIGALALIYDHFIKIYIPENGGRGGGGGEITFLHLFPPLPHPPTTYWNIYVYEITIYDR